MTSDEIRELPDDALNAKTWLLARDVSERRRMCMFFTPPEYTKNFNELYEAEKTLSPEQYSKYIESLLSLVGPLPPEFDSDYAAADCVRILRATSRQRTEALAIALGR